MSLFSIVVITNYEHMSPEATDLDSIITPEFSPFKTRKAFINPDCIEELEEQQTGFQYKNSEEGKPNPPVVVCVFRFTSGKRLAAFKPEFEQFMKNTRPYREPVTAEDLETKPEVADESEGPKSVDN